MRGMKQVERWRRCCEYTRAMAIGYEKASKLFAPGSEVYDSLVASAKHCQSVYSTLDLFTSEYSDEELKDIYLAIMSSLDLNG